MNFLSPVSSQNEGSSSIPHVCGPCYLCKSMASYYKHRNDLVGDNILAAIERHTAVTAEACICWNCIKDLYKHNTSNQNVVPACTNKKEVCNHLCSNTRILDLLGLLTAEHQHSNESPFVQLTTNPSTENYINPITPIIMYNEIKCTVAVQ